MMQEKDFLTQINKINEKVDIDTEFPDWNKTVQFIANKGKEELPFYFSVDGKKVAKVAKGRAKTADVVIEGSQESLSNLFEGNLTVIGAFITKELAITGAVGDAIGANVLIQAARVF